MSVVNGLISAVCPVCVSGFQRVWRISTFLLFKLLQLGDFQVLKFDALCGPEGIQEGGEGLLLPAGWRVWGVWLVTWWVGGSF